MGLDTSWTIPIGEIHPPLIFNMIVKQTIYGATAAITNFPCQIWNLFKFWVWTQVELSHLERVTQPAPHAAITILDITSATGVVKDYYGQIHDPLKKWVQIQVELSKTKALKFETGFLWIFWYFMRQDAHFIRFG